MIIVNPYAFGAAPETIVRTAYLAASPTGNDGTGVLDDSNYPYATFSGAATALAAAYPGQTTTIRLLTNLTQDMAGSGDWTALLVAGLTLRSNAATRFHVTGSLHLGDTSNIALTLRNIEIDTLANVTGVDQPIYITGSNNAYVHELYVAGPDGVGGGAAGSDGTSASGNGGAPGNDDDNYPTAGGTGEHVYTSGASGEAGASGSPAWDIYLYGSGLVSHITGTGGNGTPGGAGGSAANGYGGGGGAGGANLTNSGSGAPGGDGGSCSSVGGNGGTGGSGGDGATIRKESGWTISSSSLTGGSGSSGGGAGGGETTSAAGSGGPGGAGSPSGSTGASGGLDTSDGVAGGSGSGGANGSIISI